MSLTIPVVDFSQFSINKDKEKCATETLKPLASEIHAAFSNVGFVYLKNHGISQDKVTKVQNATQEFFMLPKDIKSKYARLGKPGDSHGYVCLEQERTNPSQPGDLKEAYNIQLSSSRPSWPDAEVPEFKHTVTTLFESCTVLCHHVLQMIALGLGLEDLNHFTKVHSSDTSKGFSVMRSLFYPPIKNHEVKPGQIRCGEHSDYGSITLLFQDSIGGLEIQNLQGEFIPATPIPGTVLVNIADLMQRWTGGRLKSTIHRVVNPKREILQGKSRMSIAFFAQPDKDVMIRCIDNDDRYPPIRCEDYINQRLNKTY